MIQVAFDAYTVYPSPFFFQEHKLDLPISSKLYLHMRDIQIHDLLIHYSVNE